MPLIMFEGKMGAGKTLALTYTALRNHLYMVDCDACFNRFDRRQKACGDCGCRDYSRVKIGANYHLNPDVFGEYTLIKSLSDIEEFTSGFLCLDEIGTTMANAREAMKKRNKFVNFLVRRSRKQQIQIGYTCQHRRQVDIFIRGVTDTIARPEMDKRKGVCTLWMFEYFNHPTPYAPENFISRRKFNVNPIYGLYNTHEDVPDMVIKEFLCVCQHKSSEHKENGACKYKKCPCVDLLKEET